MKKKREQLLQSIEQDDADSHDNETLDTRGLYEDTGCCTRCCFPSLKVFTTIFSIFILIARSPFVLWSLDLIYPSPVYFLAVIPTSVWIFFHALYVLIYNFGASQAHKRRAARWIWLQYVFFFTVLGIYGVEIFFTIYFRTKQSEMVGSYDSDMLFTRFLQVTICDSVTNCDHRSQ